MTGEGLIAPEFLILMARYNRWQNRSLYAAASGLTDEARKADRGAFFRSIHGTLNHLLWGDEAWMNRFAGTPRPECGIKDSPFRIAGWEELRRRRAAMDETILAWSGGVNPEWLASELTWFSGALGREVTRSCGGLVVHFFNHQTHHRGQVHAMLTAAGAKPEDTDLAFMPEGA